MLKHKMQRDKYTPADFYYEAEVTEGLEQISQDELLQRFPSQVELIRTPTQPGSGAIAFHFSGSHKALRGLKTVNSVFVVLRYPIPRPKALLGDENLRVLLRLLAEIQAHYSQADFQTFYVSAAGSKSSVLMRIKEVIAQKTGLVQGQHEGDLLIRIRRPSDRFHGWEVLVRMSPRPLSARLWRECNLAGALNATVAHAMALLTEPSPQDIFLNIGCGSGSLMVERFASQRARHVLGCDINVEALNCAQINLAASDYQGRYSLIQSDGGELPLPDTCITALCADLPFGSLVGSHEENRRLYPKILEEAARVTKAGGLFVVITHEVRLMESLISEPRHWIHQGTLSINLRGLHPRIYQLRRK